MSIVEETEELVRSFQKRFGSDSRISIENGKIAIVVQRPDEAHESKELPESD